MWKAEVMSDEHTYIAREDFKLSDESTIFFLPLVYAWEERPKLKGELLNNSDKKTNQDLCFWKFLACLGDQRYWD